MNSKHSFIVLTLLAAGLIAPPVSADENAEDAKWETYIRNGVAQSVRHGDSVWTKVGDGLVGSGEHNYLFARQELHSGDFCVRVRLSLDQLSDSAASFDIGFNQFGFDGDQPGRHNLFEQKTTDFESTIQSGTPFEFEAARRGSTLIISIDGKEVWRTGIIHQHDYPVRFGLHPGRTTMRVYEFAATGNLVDVPKLLLINPKLPRGYSIPQIDLAGDKHRQVIVDREPGQYLGHPTTVLMADGKTIFCVYPKGHGGPDALLKKSTDGGLTWSERLDVPDNWRTANNAPSLHRFMDPHGVERLFVLEGNPHMRQAMSLDQGETWTPFKRNGLHCTVPPNTAVPISGNRYLILYALNHRAGGHDIKIWQTITGDGGLTWGPERIVAETEGAAPDEPCTILSPDGKQILALMRENQRRCNSLYMLSDDEGKNWTIPRELTASLTGDRHVFQYASDGRLVISFRDRAHESPTKGDWVVWVGTYDDIIQGREGEYRMRLMDNLVENDSSYPGMELLSDGTFVATTYGHWVEGEMPFIMSVRFTLSETDALARRFTGK